MSNNLGNFESEEQKQKVVKYIVETVTRATGMEITEKDVILDVENISKEELQLIIKEMERSKASIGVTQPKEKVKTQEYSSIVPKGKAWILHKNGFSLVDKKELEEIVESQFVKSAKLPPMELIHPSEKQRFLQEVEKIKKSAREWIDRDFYFDYENNTSEVNVLTSIGKYSWKHQPTEAKEVYVQSSKDFSEDNKERVPVKAWETFRFSANEVFVVNPKAIDLMREELKEQGLE